MNALYGQKWSQFGDNFVGNHHATQVIVIENVANEADLMGERNDFAGVETALWVFANQISKAYRRMTWGRGTIHTLCK